MEILFPYNVVAFLITLFAISAIWFVGFYNFVEAKIKTSEVDAYKARVLTNYRVICSVLSILVLSAGGCFVHDNYAVREVAKQHEIVRADFAEAIDAAISRPLDQRCAFNGRTVANDWIPGDTFPCMDIGGIRIWAKYNSGDSLKVFVGRPEGLNVTRIATYSPTSGYSGIIRWIPWISTKEDDVSLNEITSSIRKALK